MPRKAREADASLDMPAPKALTKGLCTGSGGLLVNADHDDEGVTGSRAGDDPLWSRGIEEHEARRLVVHGFFNDLIRKIGVPSLEEKLTTTVEAELAKNVLKDLT